MLSQLVWIDRKGSIELIGDLQGQFGQGSGPVMALSPDGRQLALSIDNPGGTELWSFDLARGSMTRLSAGAIRVTSPIWAPDGRHVFFGASLSRLPILVKPAPAGLSRRPTCPKYA